MSAFDPCPVVIFRSNTGWWIIDVGILLPLTVAVNAAFWLIIAAGVAFGARYGWHFAGGQF